MTSPKVTLTSAAGEVTLYLAFASPSFIPPRSPGPAVSLSLVPLRARHRARSRPALGRSPPRLGVSIRAHGLLEHRHDETPHVDRRAGAFAVGGRIRRQRGLGVAADSPWISSRTAPGLTVEPFFAHVRVPSWHDQCADHGVSNARQTSSARHPDNTEHCHGDSTSGARARSAETPAGAVAAASQPLAVPPGPGRHADRELVAARPASAPGLPAGQCLRRMLGRCGV